MREEIRKKITEYDRHLLSGDSRQTESKKFGGPGARRRKQKVIPLISPLEREFVISID